MFFKSFQECCCLFSIKFNGWIRSIAFTLNEAVFLLLHCIQHNVPSANGFILCKEACKQFRYAHPLSQGELISQILTNSLLQFLNYKMCFLHCNMHWVSVHVTLADKWQEPLSYLWLHTDIFWKGYGMDRNYKVQCTELIHGKCLWNFIFQHLL
jgi:hypothetical protein